MYPNGYWSNLDPLNERQCGNDVIWNARPRALYRSRERKSQFFQKRHCGQYLGEVENLASGHVQWHPNLFSLSFLLIISIRRCRSTKSRSEALDKHGTDVYFIVSFSSRRCRTQQLYYHLPHHWDIWHYRYKVWPLKLIALPASRFWIVFGIVPKLSNKCHFDLFHI